MYVHPCISILLRAFADAFLALQRISFCKKFILNCYTTKSNKTLQIFIQSNTNMIKTLTWNDGPLIFRGALPLFTRPNTRVESLQCLFRAFLMSRMGICGIPFKNTHVVRSVDSLCTKSTVMLKQTLKVCRSKSQR